MKSSVSEPGHRICLDKIIINVIIIIIIIIECFVKLAATEQ